MEGYIETAKDMLLNEYQKQLDETNNKKIRIYHQDIYKYLENKRAFSVALKKAGEQLAYTNKHITSEFDKNKLLWYTEFKVI